MGFFNRKMKELMDNQAKVKNVVCPYCFEKYSSDDVLFRATHHDEIFKLAPDSVYDRYRRKIRLSEAGLMSAVLDPKNFQESCKRYENNALVQLTYGGSFVTTIRICPFCHNILPASVGKVPSNIISVIGASQVGKSVYMTSLIHTLQNRTAGRFRASCLAINQEINRRYKDRYENPLFVDGQLLEPTQKERYQEPILFDFKMINENKSLTLVFFDVAGEGMVDNEYLKLYAGHIKNSTGILFLVDPSQITTIKNKISLGLDEEKSYSATDEPTDVLISLKDGFMDFGPSGKIEIPTAIVLTKSDMLEFLHDEYYFKQSSNIFKNFQHNEFFDLNEFQNINGEVESFIERVDLKFQNALRSNFDTLGYFAVSALGRRPIEQKVNSAIEPIRVDEPFLWLLYKLGYIEGRDLNDSTTVLHKRKKRYF